MHDSIALARSIISSTKFSIDDLASVEHDYSGMPFKRLNAYVGESFEELSESDQEAFLNDLSTVLSIDKKDILSSQFSPEEAIRRITRLRAGQPEPDFFIQLSPQAEKFTNHIFNEVRIKNGSVKFIIGDRGMGKTTLAQMIEKKIEHLGQPVVNLVASMADRISSPALFHSMFMGNSVFNSVLEAAIKLEQSGIPDSIRKKIATFSYFPIFNAIMLYAKKTDGKKVDEFSSDFSTVTGLWLCSKPSRRMLIGNLLKNIDPCLKAPIAPDEANLASFAAQWLKFLNLLDVYPIVIIDEFEAYVGLHYKQRQKLLDFIRLTSDILWSSEGPGMCLFLTTRDGFGLIKSDPALHSRFNTKGSSVMSGLWQMESLNKWDTEKAITLFRELFLQASKSGDVFYKQARENYTSIEGFEKLLRLMLDSNRSPREKIREIIDTHDECVENHLLILSRCEAISKETLPKDIAENESIEIYANDAKFKSIAPSVQLKNLMLSLADEGCFDEAPVKNNEPTSIEYRLNLLIDSVREKNLSRELSASWPQPSISERLSTMREEASAACDLMNELKEIDENEFSFNDDSEDDYLKNDSTQILSAELFPNHHPEVSQTIDEIEKSNTVEADKSFINKFISKMKGDALKKETPWPSLLSFEKKPLLVLKSKAMTSLQKVTSELMEKSSSYSKKASNYASYRDMGASDDDYFFTEAYDFSENIPLPPSGDFIHSLNVMLSVAHWLGHLPVGQIKSKKQADSKVQSEEDATKSVLRAPINVLESLSMTRRFAYTYALASGLWIEDNSIDTYVIQWHRDILKKELYPSRQGVFFFLDGKLESIRDTDL